MIVDDGIIINGNCQMLKISFRILLIAYLNFFECVELGFIYILLDRKILINFFKKIKHYIKQSM